MERLLRAEMIGDEPDANAPATIGTWLTTFHRTLRRPDMSFPGRPGDQPLVRGAMKRDDSIASSIPTSSPAYENPETAIQEECRRGRRRENQEEAAVAQSQRIPVVPREAEDERKVDRDSSDQPEGRDLRRRRVQLVLENV